MQRHRSCGRHSNQSGRTRKLKKECVSLVGQGHRRARTLWAQGRFLGRLGERLRDGAVPPAGPQWSPVRWLGLDLLGLAWLAWLQAATLEQRHPDPRSPRPRARQRTAAGDSSWPHLNQTTSTPSSARSQAGHSCLLFGGPTTISRHHPSQATPSLSPPRDSPSGNQRTPSPLMPPTARATNRCAPP